MAEIISKSDSLNSNKKSRIQASNSKRPLFFYVNLAKRYMQQYNEGELSALGMGIRTSTVDISDESRGHPVQKAKIEILLGKTADFDALLAASFEDGDEQNLGC